MGKIIATETIASIVKEGTQRLIKDAAQEISKDSAERLHKAATKFISVINDTEDAVKQFEKYARQNSKFYHILETIKKQDQAYSSQEIIAYSEKKEAIKASMKGEALNKQLTSLYQAMDEFMLVVNFVLNQDVELIYAVQRSGKPPLLYHLKAPDLIKIDENRDHQLSARYSFSKRALDKLASEEIPRAARIDSHDIPPGLDPTYQETTDRYNHGKYKKTHVILVQKDNDWKVFKVSSFGYINEGYVSAVIEYASSENPGNGPFIGGTEDNVFTFMNNYVASTSSLSGLARGDKSIETQLNGIKKSIEFSIKSAKASLMGLAQVKKLAEEINNDVNYDISKLQEWQNSQSGEIVNKEVTEQFDIAVDKDLQAIINWIQNK